MRTQRTAAVYRLLAIILLAVVLFAPAPAHAANEVVRGDDGNLGWDPGLAMSTSAGASFIATTTMASTGAEAFKFYNGSWYGSGGAINPGSKITGISTPSGNNMTFTSAAGKTYVFKWSASGGSEGVVFELGGTPVMINTTSRVPSGAIWPGDNVTINATLSGSLVTGQGAWIRYSTDNFANSTVAQMSCTGTSCSTTIPASTNTAGATVVYYLLTSGSSIPSSGDADLFTINRSSSNYSYQVNPDGVIDQEYGSTRMIDLAEDKSGDQDVCEGDEKSDLIDFNAFSYHASSAAAGQWFMSFTIDSSANLNSGIQQGYIIGLDTGTKDTPTIDLSGSGTWQRDVAFPGDYFIGMNPSGAATLNSELYDSSRNPVGNVTVSTSTRVVGTRRQIELTLAGSGVPSDLTNNSTVNFLIMSVSDTSGDKVNDAIGNGITTECATGKVTYVQGNMQLSAASCKAAGRPTDSGQNLRQCTSNPRRDTVSSINPGATCAATAPSVRIDGAVDAGKYTMLAEDAYAGPYAGGQSALSDFDGESSAYKYYTDPNAGTSTSGGGSNLYDASSNTYNNITKKGAADVEKVYARADRDYLYLIIEGPSALGGRGSVAGEPLDRSNLYIALDTPQVDSGTDTGSTGPESANAPASRRVNFKGWAPDYVIEVVWAGNDTTADNVHLHDWSSGTTWAGAGDFQTVLAEYTSTTSGNRLFGRAATGSDGDRKGSYELAIRWDQIGGLIGSSDQLKIGVYTTGDSNLSSGADDWDVFDQGPGIGQGCTGLGCHERIGDDPGDGDSSSQSGGESDQTLYVGQTDTSTDVEPASDRGARDVDTIEGYYVFTPNTSLISCPLAVKLADFAAAQAPGGDAIVVTWETVSELNNRGFNLWRGTSEAGPDVKLNEYLIPSQSQGSPEGFVYTWEDRADLANGTTYWYWLEDLDVSGALTRHAPVSVDYVTPTAVGLAAFGARYDDGWAGLSDLRIAGLTALAAAALGWVAVRRRRMKDEG